MSNPIKLRKNRLVIEFTSSHPITEKEAVHAVQLLLERIDLEAKPIWAKNPNIYGQKFRVKQFSKVAARLPRPVVYVGAGGFYG